jgi:hypothetical protein
VLIHRCAAALNRASRVARGCSNSSAAQLECVVLKDCVASVVLAAVRVVESGEPGCDDRFELFSGECAKLQRFKRDGGVVKVSEQAPEEVATVCSEHDAHTRLALREKQQHLAEGPLGGALEGVSFVNKKEKLFAAGS